MNLMDGLGGRDKETLRQIYGGLEGVLLHWTRIGRLSEVIYFW